MNTWGNATILLARERGFKGKQAKKSRGFFSFFINLFLLLALLLFSLTCGAETITEQTISQEEVVQLVARKAQDKLSLYINQSTSETLNKPFKLNYSRGEISLLSLLIEAKSTELVSAALKRGANPDGLDESFKIPLLMAIETKQWDVAELLLKSGANPSRFISDERGFRTPVPLFYHMLAQKDEELRLFLDMAVKYKPSLKYTSEMKDSKLGYLSYALMKPSPKVVSYLLEQGEDPNQKTNHTYGTNFGIFLESVACCRVSNNKEALTRRQETLEILLKAGVNPLLKGGMSHCYDPLYIVRSRLDLLKMLLDKGLDPNDSNCYQRSHMKIAAEIGDVTLFSALVEAGGKLNNELISSMISNKDSGSLIKWLANNKKDIFEKCSVTDCQSYLRAFLMRKKHYVDSDNYVDLTDILINNLSGHPKELNRALVTAVTETNNLEVADKLLKAGASLENNDQQFWQRGLNPKAMSWLIKHHVNPFSDKKPLQERMYLESIPAEQFAGLLTMSKDSGFKKQILEQWLIATLKLLEQGSSVDFIEFDRRLALAEEYSVSINDFKTSEGKPFLSKLIDSLIERQDNLDGDIKLVWLVARGAVFSEANKSRYIDNTYLRGLIDRSDAKPLKIAPQTPHENTAFIALIEDDLDSTKEVINLLLSIGLLPENKEVGLKTLKTLKDEKMNGDIFACHYASHKAVWGWLVKNLNEDDEHLLELYNTCGSVDLPIDDSMKAVSKDKRQEWFRRNFYSTNFDLLAINAADNKSSDIKVTNNDKNTHENQENQENQEKLEKLEAILFAQLQKLSFKNKDNTKETLLKLKQIDWKAPQDILEKLVRNIGEYDRIGDYADLILLLVEMGADPTLPVSNSTYSFMEHLPLTLRGDKLNPDEDDLYNALYQNLPFSKKIGLWDAFIVRFVATSSNSSYNLRKKKFIAPLALGAFFGFTELLFIISLIVYLVKTRKKPINKTIFPKWPLQTVFWAGFVMSVIAAINLFTMVNFTTLTEPNDFMYGEPLLTWSAWFKVIIFVIILQIIALIILFKQVFINKSHPSISFFTGLMVLSITLLLPVIVGMVSANNYYFTFLLKPF